MKASTHLPPGWYDACAVCLRPAEPAVEPTPDRIVKIGRAGGKPVTPDVWQSPLNPTFQVSTRSLTSVPPLDKNPETLELE